jgi:hypothetical protein
MPPSTDDLPGRAKPVGKAKPSGGEKKRKRGKQPGVAGMNQHVETRQAVELVATGSALDPAIVGALVARSATMTRSARHRRCRSRLR